MVDEVAPALDPLLDYIIGLVEDRTRALGDILNVLLRDIDYELRVVWGDREYDRDESEEGQERNSHR